MISEVTAEIESAAAEAGVAALVVRLQPPDSTGVYRDVCNHFVAGGDRAWWWEAFLHPHEKSVLRSAQAFEVIGQLVPNPHEPIWFIAEDDQLPHFPVYDTTTDAIARTLRHSYAFEYYLIAKDLSWLICVNHHGVLFGVGDPVRSRVRSLDV